MVSDVRLIRKWGIQMSEISQRLRKQRMALHMSISEAAERAGISDSYLSRFERDVVTNISIENLEALSKALNLELVDLFDKKKKIVYGKNAKRLNNLLNSFNNDKRERISKSILDLLEDTNED